MEHLIIDFKHDISAFGPFYRFLDKIRPEIVENGLGEYLEDDMAIDGGAAEVFFSCPDSKALFDFIKADLSELQFMNGAKVTFIYGEQNVDAPEDIFYIVFKDN